MQSLKSVVECFIKVMDEDEVDVVVRAAVLFTVIRAGLLTLLAYFSAVAVNSGVAMSFAVPPAALYTQHNVPLQSVQQQLPLSAYAVVHTRDLFNSVKAPVHIDAAQVIPTTTGLKLWGTAKNGPGLAYAILEKSGSGGQGLYTEGETIVPGMTLLTVDWDHIVIERNGRQETISLPSEFSKSQVPKTLMTPKAIRGRDLDSGTIRQVSQETFQVDRREVEEAMSNLNGLFKQVRAVPYSTKDGIPQGFRLFSIKADSLIDRLGVKNGDIIQRVNGVEMSDPSTAFSLLQDLQGLAQVQVDVMRNHQPITLSYEIH